MSDVCLDSVIGRCCLAVVAFSVLTACSGDDSGSASGSAIGRLTTTVPSTTLATVVPVSPEPTGPDTPRVLATTSSRPSTASTPDPHAPQVWIQARVTADGILHVTERILFPTDVFSLIVIVTPSELPGLARDFAPQLKLLRASSPQYPGQHFPRLESVTTVKQMFFPLPTREVTLRYQMVGVTRHAQPSREGRMLAYLTALSVSSTGELPRTVTVAGASNLGCALPQQPLTMCGTDDDGVWSVTLPPRAASRAVYAQVEAG
jgi:hypothetical protein